MSEKHLEDCLFDKGFIELNNTHIEILERQVMVGKYYIDLLGIDDDGNLYVIELKQNKIDGNALSQVLHYMYYIEEFRSNGEKRSEVYGVIIGSGFSEYMELAQSMIKNVYFLNYEVEYKTKENIYSFSEYYENSEQYQNQMTKINFYAEEKIKEKEDLELDYKLRNGITDGES